jgi:hypothetical protein
MPPFQLGDTTYPSKAAAREAIRCLVKSFKDQCVLSHHKPWSTFMALVDLHPNSAYIKTPSGIRAFHIYPCSLKPSSNEVMVISKLNRKTVLSWSKLLTTTRKVENTKEKAHTRNLLSALRCSIKYQMQAYRDENRHQKRCENCLKPKKLSEMHVDHMVPFKDIVQEFRTCIWTEEEPKYFKREPKTFRCEFHKEDEGFEQAWQEYHLNRTKNRLQLICVNCNCSVLNKKGAERRPKQVQQKIKL